MDVVLKTSIGSSKTYQIEDAKQAISFKETATPNFRYIMHKINGGKESYNDMEYDLTECARILDTESLVSASFRKKRQLIMKNGWEITAKDEANLEYIKQRLLEFEFVTSKTFREFIAEIVENMVNFNNCFILKLRNDDNSSGNIRTIPSGKEFKPISGLYVLAAPTIDTATHAKTGKIIKYRHRITDEHSRQFRPDDIFHMYENKRVGITIGTPPVEAVKDDILLLRSIEQDAGAMIHRHANPMMHVQVGTDKQPARVLGDGTSEVDVYSDIIDQMPEEGGVATPHRVKINMLGAESQALRLESYLEYFKRRVLNGLCISEVDLGGSAGISGSADVASQSSKEEVRAYQETIGNFLTNYIFNELLLESPKYASSFMIPEEERVTFKFIESDLDKKIKIESHALNLYTSGLITREAAIKDMDYEESDLQEDVLPETNTVNKTNATRNSIRNNIIAPKNQYSVQDNLTFDKPSEMLDYYSADFVTFVKNLREVFPDSLLKDIKYLKAVFKRTHNLALNHGKSKANQYIEAAIFNQVGAEDNKLDK